MSHWHKRTSSSAVECCLWLSLGVTFCRSFTFQHTFNHSSFNDQNSVYSVLCVSHSKARGWESATGFQPCWESQDLCCYSLLSRRCAKGICNHRNGPSLKTWGLCDLLEVMFVIIVGTTIKIVRNSTRAGGRIAVEAAAIQLFISKSLPLSFKGVGKAASPAESHFFCSNDSKMDYCMSPTARPFVRRCPLRWFGQDC